MSSAEQAPGAPPEPTGSGTLRAMARGVAGSLAAAAILLTVWEGLENRRHNRLSVQPRIDGASVVSDENGLWRQTFRFSSDGLGPAAVTDFRVYWHGTEVWNGRVPGGATGPWQPVMEELAGDFNLTASSFTVGSVLRVGQDYDVFVAQQRSAASIGQLLDATGSLAMLLCYCSLYGDQCRGAAIGPTPVQPSACDGVGTVGSR